MQIHQIKGRHANSYVIEGDSGLLVIDVAWRGEKYVLGYIREVLKRDPKDVTLIICTHDDPDHSGGLSKLAKICHAELGIPYASRSKRRKFANDPTGLLFRLATGFREGLRPRAWTMYASPKRSARAKVLPSYLPPSSTPATNTIKTVDGLSHQAHSQNQKNNIGDQANHLLKNNAALPLFPEWTVIHTPGHSWDSCCYFHQKTGSLISGDTLLGSAKKGRLVAPSVYSNPVQMARTLKHLKTRDIRAVYPGHGRVFEGNDLLGHL